MPNPQNIVNHKFKKGQTGNPKGRPKAIPHIKELIADEVGEDGIRKIVKKLLELAKKGNVKAAEMIFEREWGRSKDNEGEPTEMIIRVKRNG